MNSDFTTLKEKTDLAEYIASRTGNTLKKVGNTINLSQCPFCTGHDCFRIDPVKQHFKCFQCPDQAGGDVYDFIQQLDNCDKAEALQILAKEHGHKLTRNAPEKKKRSPEEEKALTDKRTIFEEAAAYYHKNLINNQQAINYQRRVRIHADKTLKALRVGYTDGRLYEHLREKGYSDKQIIASGVARLENERLHDLFGHDLFIYPHLDSKGQVAGFTVKGHHKKLSYRLPGEYWGEDALFLNILAFKGKKVFLVEGENDLLSVYGRGDLQHVAAITGQITRAQLDYLTEWAPGKTVYLCFDNDDAGQAYTDKVCRRLKKLCLPDTLAKLFKAPVAEVRIIRFDECKDIDEYLKGQNSPAAALETLIKGAECYFPPLQELKVLYSTWCRDPENDKKFNYDTYGNICFEWFQARGKFFVEGENCCLYFNNRTYRIGNNTPFKALLYEVAGINAAKSGAKLVIQVIESQAYLKGDRTLTGGWLHTNIEENTIYFNLCDESSSLLKLSPGKIEKVANGTNGEQILLKNSPNMQPIRFDRKVDIRKGMDRLKTHLFDNLTCNLADRYFVICLLINSVFLHYARARGVNRFSGSNSCGKTSAAGLLSVVIMGENRVSIGTAASNFSEASVSPLVIVDNLESDAVKGDQKVFLLTTATGATRVKRDTEKTTGNAYESALAQVVVTAIEPFAEPELIQRANEIIFDHKYFNEDFKELTAVEADIRRDRDLIWSSIFKIIAHDILPDIGRKKVDALKMIGKEYPTHSKKRLNELYAMLFLILEEVTKYISQPGYENDPSEARCIFKEWIVTQNQRAFATESGSNKILYNLEALVKEYELYPDSFEKAYGLKVKSFDGGTRGKSEIAFTGSTGELHRAFDLLAKDRGTKNPFRSPGQLGARIEGSLETLKSCGWSFKRNAITTRGVRRHEFVRVVEL